MTSQVKSFPFEVALEGARTSIVLADQIKSVDWRQRNARYKGKASEAEITLRCAQKLSLSSDTGRRYISSLPFRIMSLILNSALRAPSEMPGM